MHRHLLLRPTAPLRDPGLFGGNPPSHSSQTDRVIKSAPIHSLNCVSPFHPRARKLRSPIPLPRYLKTQIALQSRTDLPVLRKPSKRRWRREGRTIKVPSSIILLREKDPLVQLHTSRRQLTSSFQVDNSKADT